MTLEQIKAAVDAGKTVHSVNSLYTVIKDKLGRYLIVCSYNNYCIGLTHQDGITMNGTPETFYIAGTSKGFDFNLDTMKYEPL